MEQLPETELPAGQVFEQPGVEQDHPIHQKRLTKPGMGFGSFNTARRTLRGV